MKLVSLFVHGFKRFAEEEKITLDGKIVSIIGPNEAGKTSILNLLYHFNNNKQFASSGASQEISRGRDYPSGHKVATLTYLIEKSDRESLNDALGLESFSWMKVTKKISEDPVEITLVASHSASLEARRKTSAVIRSQIASVQQSIKSYSLVNNSPEFDINELCTTLEQKDRALSCDSIVLLELLESEILQEREKFDESTPGLVKKIQELIAIEKPGPSMDAIKAALCKKRMPRHLLFSDEDRDLRSAYDLRAHYQKNAKTGPAPKALGNLAKSCELDLPKLYQAKADNDDGKIYTLVDNANKKLDGLLKSWTQSDIEVRLMYSEHTLNVLVKSTRGEFVKLAERSDGLRQFVAMLMFIHQEPPSEVQPILLIDEVERHLHYDAQADLMQMLAKQKLAAKVICTTHSIGCLPEDMGNVRLVQPEDPRSRVIDWFWNTNQQGFSPLLFGMGASTLAFIPIRYAVIAEGATDFLLLPAMLKELISSEHLGFQVVPGTAQGSSDQIAIINSQSPRTVYLVDGDDGGEKIVAKIKAAGVAEDKIIKLSRIDNVDTTIEDYLCIDSYLKAVNEQLLRFYGESFSVARSDIMGKCRPKALEIWCNQKKISPPSKRAIAYQLLESRHEYPLLSPESSLLVRELYEKITKAMGHTVGEEKVSGMLRIEPHPTPQSPHYG